MLRRELFGWLGGSLFSPLLLKSSKARAEEIKKPDNGPWPLNPVYTYQEVQGERWDAGRQGSFTHRLNRYPMPGTLLVALRAPGHDVPLMRIGFDGEGKPDTILIDGSSDLTADLNLEVHNTRLFGKMVVVMIDRGHLPDGAYASASYEYDIEDPRNVNGFQ